MSQPDGASGGGNEEVEVDCEEQQSQTQRSFRDDTLGTKGLLLSGVEDTPAQKPVKFDKGVQQRDLKTRSGFVDKLHIISEEESESESADSDMSINCPNDIVSDSDK